MNYKFSNRAKALKASEVRELLKVTEDKEMISLAGGLPAPELFPIEEIKQVAVMTLENEGREALQYTTTEGYTPLRKWIIDRYNKIDHTNDTVDNLMLSNGSQQALDLIGKLFLDEGDIVLCESPTYLSAIGAFKMYGCQFIDVDSDDDGMDIVQLEAIIEKNDNIKVIYVIPDFQNPTGRTWSLERRKALLEVAYRHQIIVVEDNPYGDLRFEGDVVPSIKSLDKHDLVISLGTFSKIFCPGFRIGWVLGPKEIINKFVLAKQSTDLQCNTLAQREIYNYVTNYDIDAHIEKIKAVYLRRKQLAIKTIETYFPRNIEYTNPQGGLFLWMILPDGINSKEVLEACIKEKVAFVPGHAFFANGGHENTLRINFSNATDENLVIGLKRMVKVMKQFFN